MSEKTKEVKKFQDTMYTLSLHGETIYKYKLLGTWKVRTIWPMDLVFMSTFDSHSMSIGCVGKLGHLFGFLRHYLLIICLSKLHELLHQILSYSLHEYVHGNNVQLEGWMGFEKLGLKPRFD